MKRSLHVGALALLLGACRPVPIRLPCQVFTVGTFTAENHYSLSVEASDWPLLDQPGEWIEIGFLAARPLKGAVELVHVLGAHEVERWSIRAPHGSGTSPVCRIATTAGGSTCRATVRVIPQKMQGYYYLDLNGNAVAEAGMSFNLCGPRS